MWCASRCCSPSARKSFFRLLPCQQAAPDSGPPGQRASSVAPDSGPPASCACIDTPPALAGPGRRLWWAPALPGSPAPTTWPRKVSGLLSVDPWTLGPCVALHCSFQSNSPSVSSPKVPALEQHSPACSCCGSGPASARAVRLCAGARRHAGRGFPAVLSSMLHAECRTLVLHTSFCSSPSPSPLPLPRQASRSAGVPGPRRRADRAHHSAHHDLAGWVLSATFYLIVLGRQGVSCLVGCGRATGACRPPCALPM